MKDYTKDQIEESRPTDSCLYLLNYCLDLLYSDKSHSFRELITDSGLTFEELLGALLVARDAVEDFEDYDRFY